MPHESRFSFRQHGGVCDGETWIYDGDEPIARLESKLIEQPEQSLRYFNGNPKPVNLRDLKLTPGGRPLVSGVQMYWVFKHRSLATTKLIDIRVEGQDSNCLTLTVVTCDPGGVATSRRALTLTYDDGLGSYIYDFQAHLEIHSPEALDRQEQVTFEYCDPWYNDIPGPAVPFPGMWTKRFSHLIAEEADGTVWQMPLNHMATVISPPRVLKSDGLFLPAFDSGNNPAFEFVGETAQRTSISVCNWGYDIHFGARYDRDELYGPICPHFRIRLCPDDAVRELQRRARPVPPVVYKGFDELPLYERKTSFARGLKLHEPTPCNTDPWPWLPEGEGCEWSTSEGRSDSYSLKISRDTPGPSEWIMDRESDGAWTECWTRSTAFRVTVYIKTEAVSGRGAFLALRWGVYNYPEKYPYICAQKLTGNTNWTQVEAVIRGPSPDDSGAVYIILRQDGSGTTWFDDLEVELLKG